MTTGTEYINAPSVVTRHETYEMTIRDKGGNLSKVFDFSQPSFQRSVFTGLVQKLTAVG